MNRKTGDDSDKENETPKKRRKPAGTFEWKPGMRFNKKWERAKKSDLNRQFKGKDPEGFEKEMLARLERQRKAIAGE